MVTPKSMHPSVAFIEHEANTDTLSGLDLDHHLFIHPFELHNECLFVYFSKYIPVYPCKVTIASQNH